jgi:hypothetical protein
LWQPNASQWRLICILTAVIVLLWPGSDNHSLAVKALAWVADPGNKLPQLPGDFSFQGGDDPDIVEAHDAQEANYYRVYQSSWLARLRLRLRDMPEPFDPATQQQVLIATGFIGALFVWRLGAKPARG